QEASLMWITYDPQGSFPQVPRLEGRLNKPRNHHVPPEGLASFEVGTEDLVHGSERRALFAFYEVTAPDTLTPKDQATVDAIKAAWQAEQARKDAREPNAESRLDGFLALPAIRGIKTLADADAFMDGQVTALASANTNMGRLQIPVVDLPR